MIPVSVLVCIKNEAARIARCLEALKDFDDVIVVDSHSTDGTLDIVKQYPVRVVPFTWNGQYPKKYQWSMDHAGAKHDRVLFVDADEIITPELRDEIAACDWACDGYFIKGRPVWKGAPLKHGQWNNKLALVDKNKFFFPAVNDLDIAGGNEIEGHYQPIALGGARIGQLSASMLHDCGQGWDGRHENYARWEAGMMARNAFPRDPVPRREAMKRVFRSMPLRGVFVFVYGYVARLGFLDGARGFDYALARGRYYATIARARKAMAQESAAPAPRIAAHK